MSIKVIITHYRDDIEWIKNIKYDYLVFKTNTNKFNKRYNKASIFFKYIIDNYDNLTDYTVFINGNIIDNKKENMDIKINALSFDYNYRNIYEEFPIINNYMDFSSKKMDKIMVEIEDILNKKIDVSKLENIYSPHFYVHKDNICFTKKETYQQLYNYLEKTDESPYWTEKIFEYIGHFFFTDLIQLYYINAPMENKNNIDGVMYDENIFSDGTPEYWNPVTEATGESLDSSSIYKDNIFKQDVNTINSNTYFEQEIKEEIKNIDNKIKKVNFKNIGFPHKFDLNIQNIPKNPFMVFDHIT